MTLDARLRQLDYYYQGLPNWEAAFAILATYDDATLTAALAPVANAARIERSAALVDLFATLTVPVFAVPLTAPTTEESDDH